MSTVHGLDTTDLAIARETLERELAIDLLQHPMLSLAALKAAGFKKSTFTCPDARAILDAACDWKAELKAIGEVAAEQGLDVEEVKLQVIECYAKAWLQHADCWDVPGRAGWNDKRLRAAMTDRTRDFDPDANAQALMDLLKQNTEAA